MIYFFSSCRNDTEHLFFQILQKLSEKNGEICLCTDNPAIKEGLFIEKKEELEDIIGEEDKVFIFPYSIDFSMEKYFSENFNSTGIIDWFGRRDVAFDVSIYPFYFVEEVLFPDEEIKYFWGHRFMPIAFNLNFSFNGLVLVYVEFYNLPFVLSKIYHFKKSIGIVVDKESFPDREFVFMDKRMDIYLMKTGEFFKNREVLFCVTDSRLVMYQMIFNGVPVLFVGDDPIMNEYLVYSFDEEGLKRFSSTDFLFVLSEKLLMLRGENNKYFINALKGELWQQQSLSHTITHRQ